MEIAPPKGLSSPKTTYLVNNLDATQGGVTIDSSSSEFFKVTYRIDLEDWKELRDEHKCAASVKDFIVIADLPEGFEIKVQAVNSRGPEALSYDHNVDRNRRVFTYPQSLFAGQGFTWQITRTNEQAGPTQNN